jgi:hypothetical protein
LLEELDGLEQQVVEVQRARLFEGADVVLVDLRDLLVAAVPHRRTGHVLRALHPVPGVADTG